MDSSPVEHFKCKDTAYKVLHPNLEGPAVMHLLAMPQYESSMLSNECCMTTILVIIMELVIGQTIMMEKAQIMLMR